MVDAVHQFASVSGSLQRHLWSPHCLGTAVPITDCQISVCLSRGSTTHLYCHISPRRMASLHWWTTDAVDQFVNFKVFLARISLSVLTVNFRWTFVSRYQNVSILAFIRGKGDGGDGKNLSHKMYKAPAKLSPLTNQHPVCYRLDALPVAQPTVSKHRTEIS